MTRPSPHSPDPVISVMLITGERWRLLSLPLGETREIPLRLRGQNGDLYREPCVTIDCETCVEGKYVYKQYIHTLYIAMFFSQCEHFLLGCYCILILDLSSEPSRPIPSCQKQVVHGRQRISTPSPESLCSANVNSLKNRSVF